MPVVSQMPKAILEWRLSRALELGVPAMAGEREEYWRVQTEIWRPWMQAVSEHKWSFIEGPCLDCGQLTTVMMAGNQVGSPKWSFSKKYRMTLCIECLNTGPPHYPTGWVMPDGTTYVRHSERCTSHSSFPTSSSSMHSEEASLRSLMLNTPTSSPKSTSSSAPPKTTIKPPLRAMRLSR